MPELARGAWSLAYDVAGRADAPAALLLHDLPDDRRVWRVLASAMAEDFRVITPDLRGLGQSGWPAEAEPETVPPPTLSDYAGDLVAILDAERVPAAAVIGAGFGADVALQLALDAPERVELIALAGVAPLAGEAQREGQSLRGEQGSLAARFGMARAAARAAAPLAEGYLRDSLRLRYRTMNADAFAAACEAQAMREDRRGRLASLAVPALVVVGERDPALPAARLLADALADGRLVVLDGCGRGAPFVAPRAFEAALGAFLGDVRAAEARP